MNMPTSYGGKVEPGMVFRHVGFDVYCRVVHVYPTGEVKTLACDMHGADTIQLAELTYSSACFRRRWRPRPW